MDFKEMFDELFIAVISFIFETKLGHFLFNFCFAAILIIVIVLVLHLSDGMFYSALAGAFVTSMFFAITDKNDDWV
jgi:hypothetical protein